MAEIKLIVSDVDGTLIDRTEVISEELKQTVARCQEQGIVFSLATGRTFELALPIIKALNIEGPCVEANGAYIIQKGECIKEHGFSIAPIKDILLKAHEMGMTVTLSDTFSERAMMVTDYVREHRALGNRFEELLPPENISWQYARFQKVMVMDEHRTGRIEQIREALATFADQYWITTYSDKAVELGPKGCNKATGVRELVEMMGIQMENVMACGDYRNDFEMISAAGCGVAVGNALPEIKAAADYVAEELTPPVLWRRFVLSASASKPKKPYLQDAVHP